METKNCVVPTLAALYALQNHEEGECVFCKEDNKIYSWQENDGWQPVNIDGKGLSMNLYELNKSIMAQCKVLDKNDISKKINLFDELNKTAQNIHYMLLCKEYSYYTIFEFDSMKSIPNFGVAVAEIVSNIGDVYSIEPTEDKAAIEIWIKPTGEEDALVFYLFPYDAGVVYYG